MDKEAQTLTTQSSGSPGRSLAAFGFLVLPNYPLRWASSRRAFSFASTVMNGMFRVWDGEMHLPPHNFVRDGEGNLYQWEQISGAYYEVVPVKGEVMQPTGLTDTERHTRMTLQDRLDTLRALANEQGHYLNEINFCPAGVGLQWWEESRYDEEYPSRAEAAKTLTKLKDEKRRAGLVVYDYYDDLATAVEAEMNRLLSEYD